MKYQKKKNDKHKKTWVIVGEFFFTSTCVTCGAKNAWLNSRERFLRKTVAAVAIVVDTCDVSYESNAMYYLQVIINGELCCLGALSSDQNTLKKIYKELKERKTRECSSV